MIYLAKNPFFVILIITLLLNLIFSFVFENIAINAGLAAGIAILLSPRKKRIQTQTGEKIQITWVFLKKAIILN